MTRLWLLPLLALAAVLAATGSSPAQTAQCNGVEYPPPSDPRVFVGEAPIYVKHETGFSINAAQESFVMGSEHFTVSGAASASLAGQDMAAQYTPPTLGHYVVTATWRQYRCTDIDNTTYYDVTTPPAEFDAVPGLMPKARFRTSRRPAVANSRGDATLIGTLVCPPSDRTRDDDADLVIYWEEGRKKPTHSSRHLKFHSEGGCMRKPGRFKLRRHETKGFRVEAGPSTLAAQAFAPARLRVLMEITYAGKLLGRSYGTFGPVKTGEGVARR